MDISNQTFFIEIVLKAASFGIFPLSFLIGTLIFGRSNCITLIQVILNTFMGFTLVCSFLGLLAYFEIYYPEFVGLIGWIATLKLKRLFPSHRSIVIELPRLAFICSLVIIFINVAYKSESSQGARDQGVYSNHAIYLLKNRTSIVDFNESIYTDNPNKHRYYTPKASGLYYDREKGVSYFQFAPTYATSLAIFGSAFNIDAIYLHSPLFSSLNFIILTSILLTILPRPNLAIASALLFTFSPAIIWISRITLSETVTLTTILLGIYKVATDKEVNSRTFLPFYFASLYRIDSFLIFPCITVFQVAQTLFFRKSISYKPNIKDATVHYAFFLGSILYYKITTNDYIDFHINKITLMLLLDIIAFSFLGLLKNKSKLIEKMKSPVQIIVSLTFIITTAFYLIYTPIFSNPFDSDGANNDDTLYEIAYLLSYPVFIISIGYIIITLTTHRLKQDPLTLFLIILLTPTLFLYVHNPYISPDYIWKSRRFVPIIIPVLFILFSLGLSNIHTRFSRPKVFLSAIILLAFSQYIIFTPNLILTREYNGTVANLKTLKNSIPKEKVSIAAISPRFAGPLFLSGWDKTYYVDDLKECLQILSQIDAPSVPFLTQKPVDNEAFKLKSHWIFEWDRILPNASPYILNIRTEKERFYCYEITKDTLSRSIAYFGGVDPLFCEQSGVYGLEYTNNASFRWTNGDAKFFFPHHIARRFNNIRVKVHRTSPASEYFVININGEEYSFRNSDLSENRNELDFNLSGVDLKEGLQIRIVSGQWSPATVSQSKDTRILGLSLGPCFLY